MGCLEPAYALLFAVFSAGRIRNSARRGDTPWVLAGEALLALLALTGYLVHRLGYGEVELGGVSPTALWRFLGPAVVVGYAASVTHWVRSAKLDPSLSVRRRAGIYVLGALITLALLGPVIWSNLALGLA